MGPAIREMQHLEGFVRIPLVESLETENQDVEGPQVEGHEAAGSKIGDADGCIRSPARNVESAAALCFGNRERQDAVETYLCGHLV